MSPMNNERFGLAAQRPLVASLRDKGTIWYSTDTDEVWTSDGVDWTQLGGGGGGTGVGSAYLFQDAVLTADLVVTAGARASVTPVNPLVVVTNPSAAQSMEVAITGLAPSAHLDTTGITNPIGMKSDLTWLQIGTANLGAVEESLFLSETGASSVVLFSTEVLTDVIVVHGIDVIPPLGSQTYEFQMGVVVSDDGTNPNYQTFGNRIASLSVLGVLI